jgi:diguanylate cyclase (GGDEF)-like protein
MRASVLRLGLLLTPPLAALGAGAAVVHLASPPGGGLFGALGFVFLGATAATALEVLGLALWARRAREGAAAWRREAESLGELLRGREGDLTRLRGDVEVLTAIREIGVIVNADDEFEDVLSKVLEIVGEALKADDLVLFLADAASHALEPVAHRSGKKFAYRKGLKNLPVSRDNVDEALAHGRLVESQEWNAYSFALPLVVDQEVVGVLKAFLPDPAAALKDSPRVREAREFLRGVERHLALAIKAPSLYHRAVQDGLTGLYTRRHFDTQLEGYFSLARRRKTPLAVIMSDIDHFKRINDSHGHPSGDRVLKGVARVVAREIRKYDSAYRYGGEEMAVLLPETELAAAAQIAERVRQRVEKSTFRGDRGQAVPVTLSLGVSEHRPWMEGAMDLVGAADRALYRAKESGRNRVETETGPPDGPAGGKGGKEPPGKTRRRRNPPGTPGQGRETGPGERGSEKANP